VWDPRSCGLGVISRRRRTIGKYLIECGVAAALMALCMGWAVRDLAAQSNDDTLTAGECLTEVGAAVGSVAQGLGKENIIGMNLLSTKITDGMCQDMLERSPDGTVIQSLIVAQNYIQEIQLIERSMREAQEVSSARDDILRFSDVSFASTNTTTKAFGGLAQTQYPPADAAPSSSAAPKSPSSTVSPGSPSNGERSGVDLTRRQAAQASATAAAAVAEGDASIADMLDQIEAAALKEGASRSEAAASARCGLEEALLNAISREISRKRYIKVSPDPTPNAMEYGDTVTVELMVSGDVRRLYGELERHYETVAELSEAEDGCVLFIRSIRANLFDRRFSVDPHHSSPAQRIIRDTTWTWDVTANAEGKNSVDLFVGHVLQLGEVELKPQWIEPSPVHHATIVVNVDPLREESNFIRRHWWLVLPFGIVLVAAAILLLRWLRTRTTSSR
jgi:hypothetical protein